MPALYPGVPDQENAITESILHRIRLCEDSVGKDFKRKYEELHQQYRGFKEWKQDWLGATENDRDLKVDEMKKRWGARLHIPLSFMAVETLLPRMIANSPHLTYLPRDERWQDNVRAVQQLVDWQQEQIRIELPFTEVARSGLIYGMGVGKGLALDTPLPTPYGWTTMGDVEDGDELLDEAGRPCRVVKASEVKRLDCYRITFDDGASMICDADHLWTTIGLSDRKRIGEGGDCTDWRDRWDKGKTQRAEDLAKRLYSQGGAGQKWHVVPNARSLDLPEADLLVDPYILGAWLGDGVSVHGAICGIDEPIFDEIERRGQSVKMRPSSAHKRAPTYQLAGLIGRLRALGLEGDKHIPQSYLRASHGQRLDLVRGLMDTDGSHHKHGTCEIGLTRKVLADGVAELLRSMGWKVRRYEQPTRGPLARPGGRVYRLNFTPDECPFLLPRKIEKWRPSKQAIRATGRHIASIDPVESVPTRCISVDSPRELFLAGDDMVPTHNTFWDRKARARRVMQERPYELPEEHGGKYMLGEAQDEVYFDGPRFEAINVGDFLWDPYGYDMETCDWTAQRVWLSLEKVLERLNGAWNSVGAQALDEDAIRSLPGSNQRYDQLWQARMRESGFNSTSFSERGEQIHEVIEYHDGANVYSVLDRALLVNHGENPCGEMPFQVYRPVQLSHEMVGIGVCEPLTHLQREFDTFRSQRRDATTLSLKAPTAYDDSRVRADEIDFDPTGLIPTEGDPRSALMQMPPKDIPGTSFEEEASMRGDIKEVAGLADAAEQTPATATEAQLAQATTSLRTQLFSERFESEIVHPVACQFLWLDQREIRAARKMTAPSEPGDQQQEDPDYQAPYKAIEVDPGTLAGEFEIRVAKGSLAAKNIPQERSDAQIMLQNLAHDWYLDPLKPRLEALRKLEVKRPQDWLRPAQPAVPMGVLRFLLKAGVPAQLIQRSVIAARSVEEPQRTGAAQVADMGQQ